MPAYPGPITGKNLVAVVSHDQYLLPEQRQIEFPAPTHQGGLAGNPRPQSPADLIASVRGIAHEKRIQLWSRRPNLQEDLRELGWDGAVDVGAGDYLYVVDNKLTLPQGSTVHTTPLGWTVRGNVLTLQTDLDHDTVQEIAF